MSKSCSYSVPALILSRASGKAVSRAEFEALQAEVRRMQAPPQQRGGGGEMSVPVSVTVGNISGR